MVSSTVSYAATQARRLLSAVALIIIASLIQQSWWVPAAPLVLAIAFAYAWRRGDAQKLTVLKGLILLNVAMGFAAFDWVNDYSAQASKVRVLPNPENLDEQIAFFKDAAPGLLHDFLFLGFVVLAGLWLFPGQMKEVGAWIVSPLSRLRNTLSTPKSEERRRLKVGLVFVAVMIAVSFVVKRFVEDWFIVFIILFVVSSVVAVLLGTSRSPWWFRLGSALIISPIEGALLLALRSETKAISEFSKEQGGVQLQELMSSGHYPKLIVLYFGIFGLIFGYARLRSWVIKRFGAQAAQVKRPA